MIHFDEIVPVILAGGFGTRLQSVLKEVPKPMANVAGKPFLEWILRFLKNNGLSQAVISTGYLAHVVETYFAQNAINNLDIICVEEKTPMGTAGGFLHCVQQSDLAPKAWLVLNGDSLTVAGLNPLLELATKDNFTAAILGVEQEDASRYGTLQVDDKGYLSAFLEKKPGSGLINSGIYLFSDEIISQFPGKLPLSFELDVFPWLIEKGLPIKVVQTKAPFIDIGIPESLLAASDFIESNQTHFHDYDYNTSTFKN